MYSSGSVKSHIITSPPAIFKEWKSTPTELSIGAFVCCKVLTQNIIDNIIYLYWAGILPLIEDSQESRLPYLFISKDNHIDWFPWFTIDDQLLNLISDFIIPHVFSSWNAVAVNNIWKIPNFNVFFNEATRKYLHLILYKRNLRLWNIEVQAEDSH